MCILDVLIVDLTILGLCRSRKVPQNFHACVSELSAGSFAFLFLSLALRPPSIIFLANLKTLTDPPIDKSLFRLPKTSAGSGSLLADCSKDIFETASMIFDCSMPDVTPSSLSLPTTLVDQSSKGASGKRSEFHSSSGWPVLLHV